MTRTTTKPVAFAAAVLCVYVVLVGMRMLGVAQTLELSAFDHAVRLLGPTDALDSVVSIVGITEADIRDGSWPLSDETMAEMIEAVGSGGPHAIGLDIYRDLPVPPGTQRLEQLFESDPRIIALYNFGSGNARGTAPPQVLKGSQRIGFNDVVEDSDGVVRRGILFLDDGSGDVGYALSLRLALLQLAAEGVFPAPDPDDPSLLRLGSTTFYPINSSHGGYLAADTSGYQYLLDYRGGAKRFPTVSLSALLQGDVSQDFFRDRVVLIGNTASSVPDRFKIALDSSSDAIDGIYGVEAHAYMTSQIVRYARGEGSPISTFSDFQEGLFVLLCAALGAGLGLWQVPARAFALLLGGGLGALALLQLWLLSQSSWFPVVSPTMAWLGSATLVTAWASRREAKDRGELMGLFSRHLTPALAEHLWQRRDEYFEGGRPKPERLTVTILFLDMKGYTSVCEKMEPEALIAWINEFMVEMSQATLDRGGLIMDYFGDGMMAAFGAPVPSRTEHEIRRDAEAALAAALRMESAVEELNRRRQTQSVPQVGLRIGLCTGSVVSGSIGASDRLSYTLVGDTVVTAQRLESLDDSDHDFDREPTRILISETTRDHLGSTQRSQFLGEFLLKGKVEPVRIYRVVNESTSQRVRNIPSSRTEVRDE